MTQEAKREGAEQEPQPTARYIAPLNSLGSDEYELRRPIGILIEEYKGEDVSARLPEVGTYGHGATEDLAIEDLVEVTVNYLVDLEGFPSDELGPMLLRHKARLRSLLRKTEQSEFPVEASGKSLRLIESKRKLAVLEKLAEALNLPVDPKDGPYILTPGMAVHFNEVLGGDLADEESLSPLLAPTSEECARLPKELRAKLLAIDPKVKGAYNHSLYPIIKAGILTAGDLRSTIERGDSVRNVGLGGLGFLKVAFERKA